MEKTVTSKQYETLIGWLKEARLSLGLSMRDLGNRLEVSHTYIYKIETLEYKLDVYQYAQYCEALELDPARGMKYLVKNQSDL